MVNIFKEWDNSGQNFLRMGQQWSEFSKNEKDNRQELKKLLKILKNTT